MRFLIPSVIILQLEISMGLSGVPQLEICSGGTIGVGISCCDVETFAGFCTVLLFLGFVLVS